ncbi:hypothetical protein D3C80_1586430 [compost metagenome]
MGEGAGREQGEEEGQREGLPQAGPEVGEGEDRGGHGLVGGALDIGGGRLQVFRGGRAFFSGQGLCFRRLLATLVGLFKQAQDHQRGNVGVFWSGELGTELLSNFGRKELFARTERLERLHQQGHDLLDLGWREIVGWRWRLRLHEKRAR